jgi:hypothetical protein
MTLHFTSLRKQKQLDDAIIFPPANPWTLSAFAFSVFLLGPVQGVSLS